LLTGTFLIGHAVFRFLLEFRGSDAIQAVDSVGSI